jgi:hypothetical protein
VTHELMPLLPCGSSSANDASEGLDASEDQVYGVQDLVDCAISIQEVEACTTSLTALRDQWQLLLEIDVDPLSIDEVGA